MPTKAQRRAAYKLYRELGYTPDQARNLRNRPLKALDDYYQESSQRRSDARYLGMRPQSIKAPVYDLLSKKEVKKLRSDLRELGIDGRTAYNLTRTKRNALHNYNRLKGLYDSIGTPTRSLAKKKFKQMQKLMRQGSTKDEIFRFIQDAYAALVGVINVRPTIRQPLDKKTTSKTTKRRKKPKA